MIQDTRVLQPEFIPKEVAHRDAEVNHLSRTLDPLTADEPPETPLLLGPSGTGKTCIARFTVDSCSLGCCRRTAGLCSGPYWH